MESPLPPINITILTRDSLKKSEEDEYKSWNERLREGRYLPTGSSNEENVNNIPLEDFDPYYSNQQTFVVLGYKDLIYRFNSTNSLCMLSPFNFLRRILVFILTHWIFAAFIVTVVLFNCLLLLCPIESWGLALGVEITFLSIYLVELCMIFIARGGFLDPFTALRSIWTWLDITILILGIVACGTQSQKVAGIAALRILKIIPYIPSLRVTADFVFLIALQLLEVVFFTFVTVCGFAIAGMHLFGGALTQKCIKDYKAESDPQNWLLDDSLKPGNYRFCGNESGTKDCPQQYTCTRGYGPNPNYGYTKFDSFPWAVLSALRVICQDSLDVIYQQVLETAGGLPRNGFFFLVVFSLGTFSIFCFTLAIACKALLERKEYPEEKTETFETMEKTPTAIVQMDEEGNVAADETEDQSPATSASDILQIVCGWNCEPCGSIREKLTLLTNHPIYEYIMIFILLLDAFLLSFYYYGIEFYNSKVLFLYIMQVVFFVFYIIDSILKLVALSPQMYFRDGWNTFDFFISILAIINTSWWTRAVHNVLLLRMFKLIPRWGAGAWTARIIGNSVSRFTGLFVFLFMYIYMFGLIGNHMFSMDYQENAHLFTDRKVPRWNFSDLSHSFLMIFRILCGEWVQSLWECMLVGRQSCRLFFFSAVVFGNVIMAIVFAAVAFAAFDALRYVDSILHPELTTWEWVCSFFKRVKEQPNLLKMQMKKNKTAQEVIFVEMGEDTTAQTTAEPKVETRNPLQTSWDEFQSSAKSLMDNKYFNGASILVITASSIPLAFDETNRQPGATWGLHYADILFTIYFLIEVLVLKFVSRGLIKCVTSIAWIFDFFMILEMVLTLIFYFPYAPLFPSRGYLCIRCLRAMMLISRVERLQVAARGIWRQVKFVLDFIQAGIYFWIIFAIIGLHLYNGKFLACLDNNGSVVPVTSVKSKSECTSDNVTWDNADNNFDRIDKSFVSLTHISSFDNWVDIVEHAVDIRAKNAQPDRDANFAAYFYFIAFIILCVFFTFSVIIGASRYYLYREKYHKVFMTEEQLNAYMENDKKDAKADDFLNLVPRPDIPPLGIIYDIASSELFDLLVMSFIILDVIGMGLNDFTSSEMRKYVLYWIYFAFTMAFILELIIKLVAWRQFFLMNPWNIIDSIIVIYSFITLFFEDLLHYSMAIRMIRLLRVFQLEFTNRWAKRTRSFFKAIFASYSAFFNLLLLYFIFLFSYAVLGMALFKNVKPRSGINEVINFQTFWNSVLLLFKICSFSGWSPVFHDVTYEYDCNHIDRETTKASNCGNEVHGRVYIYSCLAISYIIIMNIYSVVILEMIYQMKKMDGDIPESDEDDDPPPAIPSISASIQEFPKETPEEEGEGETENVFERPERPAEAEETPEEEEEAPAES